MSNYEKETKKEDMDNESIIPIRGGKVCNEKDSPKVQNNLRKWRHLRAKRNVEMNDDTPYWKQQSTCNAL